MDTLADSIITWITVICFCVLVFYIVRMIFRHMATLDSASELDYWINKPLFPFQVKDNSNIKIAMPYGSDLDPLLNTSTIVYSEQQ